MLLSPKSFLKIFVVELSFLPSSHLFAALVFVFAALVFVTVFFFTFLNFSFKLKSNLGYPEVFLFPIQSHVSFTQFINEGLLSSRLSINDFHF